eukprot:183198-Amphidinium_carterae.1
MVVIRRSTQILGNKENLSQVGNPLPPNSMTKWVCDSGNLLAQLSMARVRKKALPQLRMPAATWKLHPTKRLKRNG